MQEQVAKLQKQLAAAEEACRKHQQQQAAAAQRAGESATHLQKRGELILQLQAQLEEQAQLNAAMRSRLEAAGLDVADTMIAGNSAAPSAAAEAVATSHSSVTNGASAAAAAPKDVQEVQDLHERVRWLEQELEAARSAAPAVQEAAAAAETADAGAAAADSDSHAIAVNGDLAKQHQELLVYVRQLEAQATEREALLGGLLAQVGGAERAQGSCCCVG